MIYRYNLQFFAKDGPGGERTEPATPKKLNEARNKGQVAKSKEIENAFGLLALFLSLKIFIGYIGNSFLGAFHGFYATIPEIVKFHNGNLPETSLLSIYRNFLLDTLQICAPLFVVAVIVAFFSNYFQIKWKVTAKPMKPKLSKLNPIKGFGKIFSPNAVVELIKSAAKILLISYITYTYLKDKAGLLYLLYDITLNQALEMILQLVTDLGIRISLVYMIIAFADLIYQKRKFKKDMRMTKQEIKDEMKDQEGDPAIKGKQRQKMREASMRRMMQQLPEADVVITNPTHYAVAVKYDPEKYDAPLLVAKGADYLAQRIKDVAKENKIEIVENKPLARMLYANVEIGALIPPELYQAVAEVLAFVYHIQGKV